MPGTSPELYDLRRTCATFALRAGIPVFAVLRFMGSGIAMIDHRHGHLAHDSRQPAVSLLDALALDRAVDAGWTSAHESGQANARRPIARTRAHARRAEQDGPTPSSTTMVMGPGRGGLSRDLTSV